MMGTCSAISWPLSIRASSRKRSKFCSLLASWVMVTPRFALIDVICASSSAVNRLSAMAAANAATEGDDFRPNACLERRSTPLGQPIFDASLLTSANGVGSAPERFSCW
jgi:hypothetical protein